MPTRTSALWLGFYGWIALHTGAAAAGSAAWLQPVDTAASLAFELAERTARVWSENGGVRSVRLRAGERLAAVAELAQGWVAVGTRLRGGTQELLVLTGGAGPTHRLTPPPRTSPTWRTRPVPLVEDGSLEGLAWLEGSPSGALTVYAAERTPDGWGAPAMVARPLAGSQSGLAGVVLSDGSWLLVWARFDGEDDELVWSSRRAGIWSAPAAVHVTNTVPDVTPTLFPLADGALAAWSRLVDGEYRVFTARTQEDGWSAPRAVTGPGGVYPGFAGRDGAPFLLLRSAFPAGWVVLELGPSGRPLSRAVVAAADPGRPALRWDGVRPARLELPLGAEPLSWEAIP